MSLTKEQEHQYIESAKRELLCLVDEHNNVIGSVARELMRRDRLWHRSTFIFVLSSEGKFYVQVNLHSPNIFSTVVFHTLMDSLYASIALR